MRQQRAEVQHGGQRHAAAGAQQRQPEPALGPVGAGQGERQRQQQAAEIEPRPDPVARGQPLPPRARGADGRGYARQPVDLSLLGVRRGVDPEGMTEQMRAPEEEQRQQDECDRQRHPARGAFAPRPGQRQQDQLQRIDRGRFLEQQAQRQQACERQRHPGARHCRSRRAGPQPGRQQGQQRDPAIRARRQPVHTLGQRRREAEGQGRERRREPGRHPLHAPPAAAPATRPVRCCQGAPGSWPRTSRGNGCRRGPGWRTGSGSTAGGRPNLRLKCPGRSAPRYRSTAVPAPPSDGSGANWSDRRPATSRRNRVRRPARPAAPAPRSPTEAGGLVGLRAGGKGSSHVP